MENIICVYCKFIEMEFRGSLCYKFQMYSDFDYYKYLIQIFLQVVDLKIVKLCQLGYGSLVYEMMLILFEFNCICIVNMIIDMLFRDSIR